MKTVFIVNPKAGHGKHTKRILDKINSDCKDSEIYLTTGEKDAVRFVREYLINNGEGRFIACGGDGTLSEVVNGTYGFENAEVGVIPIGSGNDFVRNFSENCDFFNTGLQEKAVPEKVDLIEYKSTHEGVAVNMCNIGFDCNTADLANKLKSKTILGGAFSYVVAILVTLIKKTATDLVIETEDGVIYDGRLLLTSIANGSYCGGGIKSNPLAELNDGLININIVKDLSRLKFISLLPSYMKGTFLKKKGIEKYVTSIQCKKLKITPKSGKMRLGVDGEIHDCETVMIEAKKAAMNFIVPQREMEMAYGK
ncbi:MAG: diacylglycerol kinase family protein [Clostridia bacterium]|nr:diacylglycerol kinase family protein [Clostridia bacterium]